MDNSHSNNITAFLDVIGNSEGTTTVANSDYGYNVVVGGTLFFNNYEDHPRIRVWISNLNEYSTAAGKYQILARYYDVYKEQLGLSDFGHDAQDCIALRMIYECGATEDIEAGNFQSAVIKCSSRWASFPGNNYDQHQNKLDDLASAFIRFGGTINDSTSA